MTKKERTIAVHHGEYEDGDLTPEAKEQLSRIAAAIKKGVGNHHSICLITSPRPHAIKAAQIIEKVLGVKPVLCLQLQIDYLNYESDISMQHKTISRLARGCNTVITVSHAKTACGIIHACSGIKPEKRKGFAMVHCKGSVDIRYLPE